VNFTFDLLDMQLSTPVHSTSRSNISSRYQVRKYVMAHFLTGIYEAWWSSWPRTLTSWP